MCLLFSYLNHRFFSLSYAFFKRHYCFFICCKVFPLGPAIFRCFVYFSCFLIWKPAISNCFERKFIFHETIDFLNCLYFFKMRPLHSLLCVACVCPKWNHMFKHKLSLCVLNRKPSVFSFFGADIRKPSIFYFCVWFSNESIDFSLLLYGS